MKRCPKVVDVARRRFLTGAGYAAAGTVAVRLTLERSDAATGAARLLYPSHRLASLQDLRLNEPFEVSYPDNDAPGVLIKLGAPVKGGVGPDSDVVGFSTLCPHQGMPLAYRAADHTLSCPEHYSRFDCDAGGQQIWGHATQNLPQYVLRIDDAGNIFAEGIDELLYGRLSNVL
ncbi:MULTISPECIES: arsenate reductase (azurin) small subunit [unclassified Bradyrhizobium]|uniref:arsenate reductase (azurin) small subunit n=1 Tax=unclassified Bradyrhizobium TaxID=2631580 RepID=UPI0028EE91BF|nr:MULTISPECIES: arsenate reductase (azurin) small subunit [unclassified Bradyrhizobium]